MLLEDNSTDGVQNNHWEKSWVGNEFMSPEITTGKMFISKITLALFDDSGWYLSNKTYGHDLQWGY
jgi:hypothetical protein